MKLFRRRIAAFIGCILAASALTSCSVPNTLAVFDQPQSEADTVPAGATANVLEALDADTTRLLWTDAGLSYYAALSAEGDHCLVIVEDLEAVSGCSSTLPITVQDGASVTMMLADNLPDDSADWTKVADHLWAAA
jgi:hydroxyacyl-ACP dehydratase HTD2-like protein with hotdog domain